MNAHLATMLRLNIQYDVLPRESEILHLKFWAAAFELLKERKAIYFETEGKNNGCWVMPSSAFRGEDEANEDSKVIVRSNGTVTYVGKDIAYQLWKFGLLGKDFHYRPLMRYTDGHEVWVSTDQPQPHPAPAFGKGHAVYNVIDARQSYLQDVVVAGLRALGFDEQAERSMHFSYEMVALVAALLCRARDRTFGRRRETAVCGSFRAQRSRGEGRRSDGQADRNGAGRSFFAASGRQCGGAARDCHGNRDGRFEIFSAEVYAQHGDRFRFSGSAEF